MSRRRSLLAVSQTGGGGKTINHGVITFENWVYCLTFEFPVACNYMTVNCTPQFWEFVEGDTKKWSMGAAPEGIGNTIEIYASNYGFDDYDATNEDDTYIYEVTINV